MQSHNIVKEDTTYKMISCATILTMYDELIFKVKQISSELFNITQCIFCLHMCYYILLIISNNVIVSKYVLKCVELHVEHSITAKETLYFKL